MSQETDSEDDGYTCMELPTLIRQLKSVLDQYPDDGQILKELIQNAEDADATEMQILYDSRDIQPDVDPRLLKKRQYLASLQAPALCVYNNALFTDKDWRGIKMLHNSVKEEEPLKVGRFGLGFKSVFHVTDFPCVISGNTVLFINPHVRNLDRVCYMRKLTSLPIETRQTILQVLRGTFGFTDDVVQKGYYEGTILWFPLRKRESKLSDNCYNEKKVMDLFQAFKAEASITLLFLKSMEKIQLYHRGEETLNTDFTVQLSPACLQLVRKARKTFISEVKQLNGGIPSSSIEGQLNLTVEIQERGMISTQEWIVINFYKGGCMSEKFRQLCSDFSLSYCPYVGVAVPIGQQCQGHVFCFLPLPLQTHSPTGLQIHVNGFFALSQNRRHVKWPTADQLQNQSHTDKAIEWNSCLVCEVLPEVYCNLLKYIIQYSRQQANSDEMKQQVYRMIPAVAEVDVNWRPILSMFHDQLYCNIPFLFTPVKSGDWIKLQEGVLVDETDKLRSLIMDIFTLYNRNIVPVPSTFLKTLQSQFHNEVNIVTAEAIFETLRSDDKYISLPRSTKLTLVQYLLGSDQYELLKDLYLLPVADGSFAQFGKCDAVICDSPAEVELFPGLNHQFTETGLTRDLHKLLKRRASDGDLGLSVMTPRIFPRLLRKCLLKHFPGGNAELPSEYLNLSWLKQVWTYIKDHGINAQSTFRDFKILPDVDSPGRGKLHSFDNVFIAQSVANMGSLPLNVGSALQKLNIIHLKHVPDFVLQNPNVFGKVILYPTQDGVMSALEKLSEHAGLNIAVQRFNSKAHKQERKALVEYMSHCQMSNKTMVVLRKLAIFTATDGSDCSVESQLTLAPDENIPVQYPQQYMQYSSFTEKKLALKLGVPQESFPYVCQQILNEMLYKYTYIYTDNQITDFIEFLMERHQQIIENTKEVVSQIEYLSSGNGRDGLRACDLFSPDSDFLGKLFCMEDKFPAHRHTRTDTLKKGLRIIGLKTEEGVTEGDIVTSAGKIEELVHTGKNSDAEVKTSGLIKYLEKNWKRYSLPLLSELKVRKCIPCLQQKPDTYPSSLTWKGESSGPLLCSEDVYSCKYSSVIGSVCPVASAVHKSVEPILGLSRHPEPHQVIQHLRNMGSVYTRREHYCYMDSLENIYSFLQSQSLSGPDQEMLACTKCVWVGVEDGFQYPKSVYIPKYSDLDLKPYKFPLPSLLSKWSSLLQGCGCHQSQTPTMLTSVLEEIKEKHDGFKTSNTKRPTDVKNDLKLILQILNELKNYRPLPDRVYLPVHQKNDEFLILLPAKQCTYCNADWLKDQTSDDTEDDEIWFVHSNISETTAQQLGVCSLTDRVMDDTHDFDMEYHQSEPLTRRLKNLLREYTDGFSVPKELIQNADDAGATEVCFMYDERQNHDARTSLMNENMAALQGPAFWAYNNSNFKESDFNNIKKLSGATKEEDTTKVGKFGLGFNSVYNLTDVPSFISLNTMVIFDPHERHLGKPGLKANLTTVKNSKMLRKMSGQFKPFEGVFGCRFRRQAPSEPICNGTLFRFPLRTQDQASESEIKDLSYSAYEMGEFFKKFAESSGNLLLFTQNVSCVKFYHLPPNGDPAHPELLLHVKKTIQNQTILYRVGSSLSGQSVLSYAAKEWKKQPSEGLKIRERTDLHLQIFNAGMTRKLKLVAAVNTIPWLIIWVTGQREAGNFAQSGKLKGLLPLAAVALPLRMEDGANGVYEMNECPTGFYKEGHYFCFLPLPVHVPFPVHINATFALTSDRRQLCTQTEDDKELHEAVWNQVLKQDAVCRSYISALVEMPVDLQSNISSFYQLWPYSCQSEGPMVKSFYQVVAQEDAQVFLFPHGGSIRRTSFQRIRFLNQTLHCDAVVGNIAFKAAVHFWNNTETDIVDVPSRILESFRNADLSDELELRCMSTFEFFSTIFFPNICDAYWTKEDRDKLTIYALHLKDSDIHHLMVATACVPVRPHGVLKQPRQLVHPHGQCAAMFLDEDECFPTGRELQGFTEPHLLEIMCRLGMVRDDLPGESLLERALSVASLHQRQPQEAVRRCWKIVGYISGTVYSSRELVKKQRIDGYTEEVIQQLKGIPFLPILQHPTTWPLSWKADEIPHQVFAKANEMFNSKVLHLVGCSKLVIDSSYPGYLRNEEDVLTLIGLHHKDEIDIDTAARQLLYVAEKINCPTNPSLLKQLSDMCLDIYHYLKHCFEDNIEHKTTTHEILRNECVILVGERMVQPHQVAFRLSQDLSPHLYQVSTSHATVFRHLFEVLGVKSSFDIQDILAVVQSISDETALEKLTKENLSCIERLMIALIDILPDSYDKSEISDVMLPDRHGFLYKASSLCLDDCDWVDEDDDMVFLHPNIHPVAAKWLGVKGKREADLCDHISSIESFGQSEKLTSRIRRILSGYPCDVSIMKELLQNADDAGATVLMFIKDYRSLPTTQVFGENWSSLQGPALCVYNDSFFTDTDFAGIKNLGEGSKGADPLKTGQYGVGFNAVYHLTDVPSFMTVGPTTTKTICALDPHVKYVPWATCKNPGVKIQDLDKLRLKYKDAFEGYLERCVPLQEKGTLFRFPLRTEAMAEDSIISNKAITTDMITDLLGEFKKDMFDSLLFLHNVKKIVIASISVDGELSTEYSLESKVTEGDSEEQKRFMEDLRDQAVARKSLPALKPLELKLSLEVHDSTGNKQKWLVVHRSGFTTDKDIPVTITSAWERGDIGLLPRGGIAVPIPHKSAHNRSSIKGKAFCILPLPVLTGLPVHVNGHFALDHEARRNLWHGSQDHRSDWNKHIVEAIVIPAYLSAMETMKTKMCCTQTFQVKVLQQNLKGYYLFLPDILKATDTFWKYLAKSFYTNIVQKKSDIFGVIKPVQGKFSDHNENRTCDIIASVVWVSVTNDVGFAGYFNDLWSYYKIEQSQFRPFHSPASTQKRHDEALAKARRNTQKLSEVLRDLNMKVIDAPFQIYGQFIEAELSDKISCVTPEKTLQFLKSYADESHDKCTVGTLPRMVEETPYKSVATLKLLTGFIAKADLFASEISGLPLAMTISRKVAVFTSSEPLIVTSFTDLLTSIPDVALHPEIACFYMKLITQSSSLMAMQIGTFASMLPDILVPQTFACKSLIPWQQNPDFPTYGWIARLWQYLNEEINKISEQNKTEGGLRYQLEPLSTWCLLPAKRNTFDFFLCSIKDSSKIIDSDSVTDSTCARVLEKMKKLHFHETMLSNENLFKVVELVPKLVANWKKPDAVLFALSAENPISQSVLETEAISFLNYFCLNLDILKQSQNIPSVKARLKSLPFYPTVTGRLVPVMGDVYAVKSSYELPKADLDQWSEVTGKTLLKYNELTEYLGIPTLTLTEVYSSLLIPSFHHFPRCAKPVHLKFIKESLLQKSEAYSSQQRQLIEQLRMLPFIETSDGTLHRAKEFYSRKEVVFATMCPDSAFPPDPYNNDEWHYFLVLIGLQAIVSVDQFVFFVRQVEELGLKGISIDAARKSEVLMKHLCRRHEKIEEGILGRIKAIKFLLPYVVDEEHEDGTILTQIHPQFQAAKSLVCFSESLGPQHCYCVWTSCSMFRREYDPSKSEYKDKKKIVYSQLGIPDSPTANTVVQHVLNICTSVAKMQKKLPIQSKAVLESLKKVMKAVYEYLQDNGISDEVKKKLTATCLVYLPEEKIFVAADEVVTRLSMEEVIYGYVYAGPLSFGEFFPVFEALGAAQTASAKTFACALQKLHGQVGNKELNPNELHVVKTAMELLFNKYLRNSTSSSLDPLFLPNCDNIMTLSTKLVFSDNRSLRQRVEKLKLNFFVGFRQLEIDVIDPLQTISLLTPEHRPAILSKVMTEKLTDTCIGSACKGSISSKILTVIQTPEFISGLVRLVNQAKIIKELKQLERADCEALEHDLSNIELFEVEHLETWIIYNGNVVEGSEFPKTCVTVKEQQSVHIYISTNAMTADEDSVYSSLSFAINELTGYHLGPYCVTLLRLLKSESQKIHEILDICKITAFDYSSRQMCRTVFPPPGTTIPEKFHFMLDNSFSYFKEGEYAGYEVYDPLIDDEDDNLTGEMDDGDVFMVYVIIKKVVTLGDTPLQARYIIEGKDGTTMEVCATQLYKFFRDTEDRMIEKSAVSPDSPLEVPLALEDVLREIRNTLKEAWAMLGEHDRGRVKKRLYFKWHPDKNPDRSDFCNEVCKYIGIYIERLEKGLTIDDIHDEPDGGKSTDYAWFHRFNERTSRHRTYQEEYRHSYQNFRGGSYGAGYGYGSGYGSGSFHQSTGNPDRSEARRWLRQAKADLDAGREALGLSRAYNWICFMGQQAAEKAIKAMLYNKDSIQADAMRTHDLSSLSSGLGNPSLTRLASQLQNVIQDFNRLRYPDRLAYPRIPAEVYTQADASQACELAGNLVCLVEQSLH